MTWKFLRRYLNENGTTYREYLKTDHWQDVRHRYWASKLHNHTCYACHATGRLEVHHRTYKRIGREWLNDLLLLCRDCHKATHELAELGSKIGKGSRLFGAAKRVRKTLARSGERTHKMKHHPTFTACNMPGHDCRKHCRDRNADGKPCQSPRYDGGMFCKEHAK